MLVTSTCTADVSHIWRWTNYSDGNFCETADKHDVVLSAKKSLFFSTGINWRVRIICVNGYCFDPRTSETLKLMAEPFITGELSKFVHCCSYMSLSIPDFQRDCEPFHDIIEKAYKTSGKRTETYMKNINLSTLSWGAQHDKTFRYLQDSLRRTM